MNKRLFAFHFPSESHLLSTIRTTIGLGLNCTPNDTRNRSKYLGISHLIVGERKNEKENQGTKGIEKFFNIIERILKFPKYSSSKSVPT